MNLKFKQVFGDGFCLLAGKRRAQLVCSGGLSNPLHCAHTHVPALRVCTGMVTTSNLT